jgi:hypothetical protein
VEQAMRLAGPTFPTRATSSGLSYWLMQRVDGVTLGTQPFDLVGGFASHAPDAEQLSETCRQADFTSRGHV